MSEQTLERRIETAIKIVHLKQEFANSILRNLNFGRSSFKRKSLKDIRALRRFSVSILIDINEEWMTTKMYLNIDAD